MSDYAVEVQDVSKSYGPVAALNRLSLAMERGKFVVLLGPSGSGKTTLLSILGGFTEPTTGRILIGGHDVTNLPPARRPTVTVFQDYALFPHMTVRENVAFGLEMRKVPRQERTKLADRALGVVGLESFGSRRIHQLSGGQRQRVALARAIVIEPEVLLLDEPLGALDVKIRRQMQDELLQLQRQLGASFIHVTHDQEEAMSIADVVVLMSNGKIEDVGPPERIYRRPASVFAATFMGDTNLLEGVVKRTDAGASQIETTIGLINAVGDHARGDRVHISIRPENLHLGMADNSNAITLGPARLREAVFQGTHWRCRAELVNAPDISLTVRLPPQSQVRIDNIDELWVSAEHSVVLPRVS